MTIPVPQRINNKLSEDFYPLQKQELMALRQVKLINNAAYVHLALRSENPFCDRPVQIIPKEFALRWQIPESSVYKAIAKLKDLGVLNIKSGKLVIDWIIKSENQDTEAVTEDIAVNDFPKSAENYQIEQKIIRSDNPVSDSAKDYQNRENRKLKPLQNIASTISQTIQTIQTCQTRGEESEKNFSQEEIQNQKINEEKDLVQSCSSVSAEASVELSVVNSDKSLRQTCCDVVQEKTKIISPSKKRCIKLCDVNDPADETSAKERAPRQPADKRSLYEEIPDDLKEKLRELSIPLDKKVLNAIASHDISQAYGACAHVENTWHTITHPCSVFLYQLPKQPIEKLGSRYDEELLNNIKAQNQAIEEERKNPEYQKKIKDNFDKIRAILQEKKQQ